MNIKILKYVWLLFKANIILKYSIGNIYEYYIKTLKIKRKVFFILINLLYILKNLSIIFYKDKFIIILVINII